ncbi:unnamed protein product [Symbiodinium pilosum]|uniref:Uncharacterized protein n=1 Tax=Symbiodinium pilosum TaxID=2952 RepID=A0A812W7Y5_SYMPI|nr:unnamed protein product [Symbiodinium pilosum]
MGTCKKMPFLVRVLDQGRNIALWAYEKVQEAHPMVRLVSQAVVRGFGAVAGNTWQADPVEVAVVVPPADATVLPLPSMEDPSTLELEFTYGLGGERPLGRVPARAGMAVSFVCLDDEIHIDNIDKMDNDGTLVTAAPADLVGSSSAAWLMIFQCGLRPSPPTTTPTISPAQNLSG